MVSVFHVCFVCIKQCTIASQERVHSMELEDM
jgi:hypothetical protein